MVFYCQRFPWVIGPFVGQELLVAVNWQAWQDFSICTMLFEMTCLVTWRHIDGLVPLHADFAKEHNEMFTRKN